MYSPTLSRYARGGAGPAPTAGSGPHRPSPTSSLPPSALRTFVPDDDDDEDELLSANELVKTLQPPPSAAGGRARPARGGLMGPAPTHQNAGPLAPPTRGGAMLTPHDYFQPPPRLPRDADWHALDGGADAGAAFPYTDMGLDALPVGPPPPGRRAKYPATAHHHPPVGMDELPPEQSRARAYQLMLEHQRQAQYHNQLQLRHYHQQQQQQYPTNPVHEQQLHRQRQQQQAAVAAAAAMAAGSRGYPMDDLDRSDSPIAAQAPLRRRGSGSRSASSSSSGAGRGGFEHAHRIHRELQPPPGLPSAYPMRHYASSPSDMMPASLEMSMAPAAASRPAAGARRRVASPASPDFDPQFDLLQFDPSGMDLYDAGDMPLSLAATSALDVNDDLLGRPVGGHGGAMSSSGANGTNGSARRLSRPMSGAVRRGAPPAVSSASPSAAMAPARGYTTRYEREMDVESSTTAADARRARPPPSEPSQGAAKRPKVPTSATSWASSAASTPTAQAATSAGGVSASAKRSAAGKAAKSKGTKAAGASAAKAAAPKPATSTSSTSSAPTAAATADAAAEDAPPPEQKRRCGRKSMNYSSEQKRERNRAAVKKCRQRQALKLEYLQHKAEVLQAENQALSDMLVKNVKLDEAKRRSLTRGIQMDILLKIKEIFTQSLPKDFVLDADSIWDLNSVLAVSMPSRCYYGIESIKDFWRTSLRMRNKGKIRSFWAWLFRLPPGDRFLEFTIEPFSPTSSLYFISWTTKSDPPLAGSMVIMFGHGHRVTLHVECFGWLIWRYLLTNEPFPEPPME